MVYSLYEFDEKWSNSIRLKLIKLGKSVLGKTSFFVMNIEYFWRYLSYKTFKQRWFNVFFLFRLLGLLDDVYMTHFCQNVMTEINIFYYSGSIS